MFDAKLIQISEGGFYMKLFAHRGFSAKYPENTLVAFKKAAELAVHGVELDVHLTADGQVVVIHDERINRTSNGKGFVKDYTLKQLQILDFGSWFDPQFRNERIPTLHEVLSLLKNTPLQVNIELKTDVFEYEGIEKNVFQIIQAFDMTQQIIISSFNHESLLRFQKLTDAIPTVPLFSTLVVDLESYLKQFHSNAMHIEYFHTERAIIKQAMANGVLARTFTVNDIEIAKLLKQRGVEAIFTDHPQLMLAHL